MAGYFFTCLMILTLPFTAISSHETATDREKNVDSIVKDFYQQGMFNGVILLAKEDSILYSGVFGKANFEWDVPLTLDTRFRIASITKTFTAVLTLKLIEQGKLNFDDVITDHLPDYPSKTGDIITIEHLLVQSSGIPDYLTLPGFMESKSALVHNIYEFPNYFKDLDLNFEPGSDWNYGNSEYYLLGLIIEQITNMSYEAAMQAYILDPAGLTNTGFVTADSVIEKFAGGYIMTSSGIEIASIIHPSVCYSAGMMYSTAGDLHKFMNALYLRNTILSEEYTRKLTIERMANYGCGVYVGYQVIDNVRNPAFLHVGEIHGYAVQVTYFPEKEYTLVIMDNTQQCPARLYFAIMETLPGFSD